MTWKKGATIINIFILCNISPLREKIFIFLINILNGKSILSFFTFSTLTRVTHMNFHWRPIWVVIWTHAMRDTCMKRFYIYLPFVFETLIFFTVCTQYRRIQVLSTSTSIYYFINEKNCLWQLSTSENHDIEPPVNPLSNLLRLNRHPSNCFFWKFNMTNDDGPRLQVSYVSRCKWSSSFIRIS